MGLGRGDWERDGPGSEGLGKGRTGKRGTGKGVEGEDWEGVMGMGPVAEIT